MDIFAHFEIPHRKCTLQRACTINFISFCFAFLFCLFSFPFFASPFGQLHFSVFFCVCAYFQTIFRLQKLNQLSYWSEFNESHLKIYQLLIKYVRNHMEMDGNQISQSKMHHSWFAQRQQYNRITTKIKRERKCFHIGCDFVVHLFDDLRAQSVPNVIVADNHDDDDCCTMCIVQPVRIDFAPKMFAFSILRALLLGLELDFKTEGKTNPRIHRQSKHNNNPKHIRNNEKMKCICEAVQCQ